MAEDAAAVAASAATKPQKPDEAAFKEKVGKLEKEHTQVKSQLDAVKAKIELATPGKNPENPTQKRRQELIAQLTEIRKKQGDGKNSRTAAQEQIKRLDEQIKERKKELKTLQETIGFRDEAALDNRIKELDAQVASGKLTLLDEKKTVEQIGKLRRSRKQFPLIQEKQKAVDELDAKIKETKGKSNNPEAKALSEQYNTIQAELDTIKAEQDAAYKELSSLRDERSKFQAQQREKWDELKKCKDEYHTARKAFNNWEREQKQKAWERNKAERERQEKERKKERAQKMLAEASDAAYLDEIRRANSLLHFFDPSFVGEEKAPLQASSGLQAQADRKVDDSGIKGTKIVSKKELDDDYLPAVKKGKKGKKKSATKTASSFNCPPSVVEDCAFMNIDPPMSADEVPAVIEKVKAKLDHWKSDQSAQTQRNIEKAQKEIEKLEAEEAKEKEGGKKSGSATPNGDAVENGDKAVDAVAKDVADASLEDKKDAEAVATA